MSAPWQIHTGQGCPVGHEQPCVRLRIGGAELHMRRSDTHELIEALRRALRATQQEEQ